MAIFGFIGTGNMGGAMARASAKCISGENLLFSNRTHAKAEALAAELGGQAMDNKSVAQKADFIFLGVKPQMMAGVLKTLKPILQAKKPLLISMAAGLTMAQIEEMAGGDLPVIRIMPNTPVAVGKGLTLYCANEQVSPEVLADFLADMDASGIMDPVEERLFDAAGTVSGCGPAYLYMFIEAMADGAVSCGVPRAQAMKYAAATMAGAAEMVLQTGLHPGQLKDNVCSPGGSTIAGVKALEDGAFRSTVMNCIQAATKRNSELGK